MLLTVVSGVLVVGGICLLALAGFELVQRLVSADARKEHNDVAGFIYAALGVIYAVLLALVVIAVWEEYGAASNTVEQEANATAEIFWLAHRLPEPEGTHIQELARSYAEEVVHKEWPLMEQGRTPLMEQGKEHPQGGPLSTTSGKVCRMSNHKRPPTSSSTPRASTRSRGWPTPGGCA